MKNLVLRSISGVVYVALIVAAVILGEKWCFLLTAIFATIGVCELQSIVMIRRNSLLAHSIALVDVFTAAFLSWIPLFTNPLETLVYLPVVIIAYFLVRGVLALYDRRERPFRNVAWSLLSVVYLGVPLMALNAIYSDGFPGSKWMVLTIFVMIWLNDTGAYCVGSLLGRHKMFPRLSPKKSWEGFAGGLAFCLLAGWACSVWFNTFGWQLWQWLIAGAVVCAFSTWGDLFESLLKRNAGVKDSGNIIPGHGGILDRIDSLLFVAPAMLLFILCVD